MARFGIKAIGIRAFDPHYLWAYIKVFYEKGFWSIGNIGAGAGPGGAAAPPVKGIFLAAVWLAEAGMIVGVAAWTAWRGISSQPFCETCNRWTTIEPNVQRLVPGSGQANSLERVKAGDLTALGEFTRARIGVRAYLQLDLARCPSCQQSNFLSIHSCQDTVDRNGKPKVVKTAVIENLIIGAARRASRARGGPGSRGRQAAATSRLPASAQGGSKEQKT